MIIKSHVRGGYRAAADYLKDQGKNEFTRLVEISDPDAKDLDDAFHNMWVVASNTKCTKALHHVSINPYKDERLNDKQVLKIAERLEEAYGYKLFHHQRVIVEHIKDGRQHFHVMWNRVSLTTGRPVWPGHHWLKSKQVAQEMESQLGLKSPARMRLQQKPKCPDRIRQLAKLPCHYRKLMRAQQSRQRAPSASVMPARLRLRRRRPALFPAPAFMSRPGIRRGRSKKYKNQPDSEKLPFRRPEWETAQLLAWAFENGRADILAQFGIFVEPEVLGP